MMTHNFHNVMNVQFIYLFIYFSYIVNCALGATGKGPGGWFTPLHVKEKREGGTVTKRGPNQ